MTTEKKVEIAAVYDSGASGAYGTRPVVEINCPLLSIDLPLSL